MSERKGRCVSARLEVQMAIIPLKREYKKAHPEVGDEVARVIAYEAFRQEMQRQTFEMKRAIWRGGPLWTL